jgi:hypothetical protein
MHQSSSEKIRQFCTKSQLEIFEHYDKVRQENAKAQKKRRNKRMALNRRPVKPVDEARKIRQEEAKKIKKAHQKKQMLIRMKENRANKRSKRAKGRIIFLQGGRCSPR